MPSQEKLCYTDDHPEPEITDSRQHKGKPYIKTEKRLLKSAVDITDDQKDQRIITDQLSAGDIPEQTTDETDPYSLFLSYHKTGKSRNDQKQIGAYGGKRDAAEQHALSQKRDQYDQYFYDKTIAVQR